MHRIFSHKGEASHGLAGLAHDQAKLLARSLPRAVLDEVGGLCCQVDIFQKTPSRARAINLSHTVVIKQKGVGCDVLWMNCQGNK